jgi:hypothetical protein
MRISITIAGTFLSEVEIDVPGAQEVKQSPIWG